MPLGRVDEDDLVPVWYPAMKGALLKVTGEFESPLHWTGKARMIVRWHTERGRVVDYAVTLTTL